MKFIVLELQKQAPRFALAVRNVGDESHYRVIALFYTRFTADTHCKIMNSAEAALMLEAMTDANVNGILRQRAESVQTQEDADNAMEAFRQQHAKKIQRS